MNAREEEIFDIIRPIIAVQLCRDEEEIKFESNFTRDLGADSLDMAELVMAFEQRFDMVIPDEDSAQIPTVGEAAAYIVKKE